MRPLRIALAQARRSPHGQKSNNRTQSGLEPLVSIEELGEYLDVPATTIRAEQARPSLGGHNCIGDAGSGLRLRSGDVSGNAPIAARTCPRAA